MTEAFAHVSGNVVTNAEIHVPPIGPWWADVDFDQAPDLSGAVVLTVGSLELRGTVSARADGTRGEQRKTRIVGGAGGWSSSLPAKAYHADNGVKALLVAQDAARECGETLGAFVPASASVGIDYVRQSGSAARALEAAAGSVSWWVGFDGVTQVGTRETSTVPAGAYELIDFDPRNRIATLAVDDLASIVVGSVFSEHFDAPQTVRELVIVVQPESVRVQAWTGGQDAGRGRLAGALASIVDQIQAKRLFGCYRYRAVKMTGDRVELQVVRRQSGLPDVLPVSMWPGLAGVHAELAPGAEVLVEFIEGDRSMPIVSGFVGKGGPGAVPIRIDFGADPTSYVALATKADAVLDMLFDLLSGTQVMDPTTGLPVVGGIWTPVGTLADATALKTAATAIKTAVISTASVLVRST